MSSLFSHPIHHRHLLLHESKRLALYRFLVLLTIFLGYFLFLSYQYGFREAVIGAVLAWSFFVLCTPVADAGFLLDFPLRVFFHIRMIFSEIAVWALAIGLNVFLLATHPIFYDQTFLAKLLKQILLHPYPYWLIIIFSAVGTLLSVIFGDELLDVIRHEERILHRKHRSQYWLLTLLTLALILFFLYHGLLHALGVKLAV